MSGSGAGPYNHPQPLVRRVDDRLVPSALVHRPPWCLPTAPVRNAPAPPALQDGTSARRAKNAGLDTKLVVGVGDDRELARGGDEPARASSEHKHDPTRVLAL